MYKNHEVREIIFHLSIDKGRCEAYYDYKSI